jgi:ferredoxin
MKIIVDLTRCQGYAHCAFAAPDVFEMRGDEALLYDADPDDAQREKVVRAAAACPVQAILVDREGARRRQPMATSGAPHLALPEFWSTQFGTEIKSVGVPTYADQVVIAQGSVPERRFVAAYGYRGRITAAVAFNQAKWLEFYEGLIDQAAPFPGSFHTVDQPTDTHPVAAEIPDRPTHQATVVTGHEPSERRAAFVRREYL